MAEEYLNKIADTIKKEILREKIRDWDLYIYDEQVNSVHFRKTDIEMEAERHNISYYIRVFNKLPENIMGIGTVQLNVISDEEISKALKRAKNLSQIHIGPAYDLVSSGLKYSQPSVTDPKVWNEPGGFIREYSIELKQNLSEIMRAETTFGKFRVYKTHKMLLNCNGFRKIKPSNHYHYEFAFRAKDNLTGKLAEYWTKGRNKHVELLRIADFIPEWTTMASDALKAESPESENSIDVLFTPNLGRVAFLETIGYAISGPAQFSQTSPFHISEEVAVPQLNIIDNGIIDEGLNSSAWDSEGFPKGKNPIIENGIVSNFIYDQAFGNLMNTQSTGNAQRYPQKGGVMEVELNNLYVSPGDQSLADIVSNSKKMLYVNQFSWLHPNPITGDFGATIRHGYLIENGQITKPIRGGTLSGNIYNMIRNIGAISKETRLVENARIPFIQFNGLRLSSK